jgi:hypothetical protein
MAIRDFKQYLYNVQKQYVEMKMDLEDFQQALADGYITEDKLEAIKEDFRAVEDNYHRLLWVEFLLGVPNRKSKKDKYKKSQQKLIDGFEYFKADENSVISENENLLKHFREEIKKLSK